MYLNFALIFASARGPRPDLEIEAHLLSLSLAAAGPAELDTMMYFSLTTPDDGALIWKRCSDNYLAIAVARLVTLELDGRRR